MRSPRKVALVAVVALVALLTVGVAAASAHGRPGHGLRISIGPLVKQSAEQLGVTRANLKEAIVDSAFTSVDEAVEDEELDAGEAEELKEEASDNLRVAYALSRTRTVAANLGISTAKLNSAFRTARRALLLAKIDRAVANGDLDEEKAAELKERLANAKLPGYKPAGCGSGFGPGLRGERGFGR